MSTENPTTRMYIHRRFVVRFLIVLLVLLSVASFVSIGLGLGLNTSSESQEDSGTPTRLVDTSPFYVLFIGSDSLVGTSLYTGDIASQTGDKPQADSLLLARIDPANCVLTLVTVPSNTVLEDSDSMVRDTLSDDSPLQTVHTVERITSVSIRYYFLMDFSGFETLLGKIGPVTADVPVSITMQDPLTAKNITVGAGTNVKLDAAGTLAYLRSTAPYAVDADPHRQLNTRNVLTELVFDVLGFGDEDVRKVLGVFEEEVQTNIDNSTLISLVTRFYDEKKSVQVYACTGPYLASAVNANGDPIVERQVTAWRELMTVVDSGEDPAAVLPQYDFQGSESDYVKEESPRSTSSAASTSSTGSKKAGSATTSKTGGSSKSASSASKGA